MNKQFVRHSAKKGKSRSVATALLGLAVLGGVLVPVAPVSPSYAKELFLDSGTDAESSATEETPAPEEGAVGDLAPEEGMTADSKADSVVEREELSDPLEPEIAPLAFEGFCANSNEYYALDRPGTGNARIRKLTFNDASNTVNAANTVFPATGSFSIANSGSANALGVSRSGDFYFTAQRTLNNGNAVVDIYRYSMSSANAGTLSPVRTGESLGGSGMTVVAGAVDPGDDSYYFGYFRGGGSNQTPFALHLFRYATNQTPAVKKIIQAEIKNPDSMTTSANGDFAFDGDGNLHFVVSNAGTSSSTRGKALTGSIEQQAIQQAVAASGTQSVQATAGITGLQNTNTGTDGYNGIAFTGNGKLIIEQGNVQRLTNPFTFAGLGANNTTPTGVGSLVDLASCMTPPTLSVNKNVVDRFAPSDQFELSAKAALNINLGKVTTTGSATGIQTEKIGPVPVLAGEKYSIDESVFPAANGDRYLSSYRCVAAAAGSIPELVVSEGTGRFSEFTFPTTLYTDGRSVTCTFTNEVKKPKLKVKKESVAPSHTVVNAGDTVSYKLTFDNSEGTAAAPINHVDHLRDVLDDADFVTGSLRYGDGSELLNYPASSIGTPGIAATQQIAAAPPVITIEGSVAAGETRTVWFQVKVKANDVNAGDRLGAEDPMQGYLLRNYLTEKGIDPPTECVAPAEGDDPMCAEHPVRAWTVSKDSQPGDGASLHTGGNVYYRVAVDNLSAQNLTGVVLEDDLTETLRATTWDTAYPSLVAVPHGISLWSGAQGTGDQLKLDGNGQCVAVANNQEAAYGSAFVPTPQFTGGTVDPGDPNDFVDGTWTMTTQPFDIPSCAASAVIGYVVEVGYQADWKGSDATARLKDSTGIDVAADPNITWVNTAQGRAATIDIDGTPTEVWPNQCSTNANNGDGIPPGWDENGPSGQYGECKTWHQLEESYFHIQKNGMTTDGSGNTVWNLQGAEFVLADTQAQAEAGEWSKWLCRANNDPTMSGYVAPGSSPSISGDPAWGKGSSVHANILAWNESHSAADQVPVCGLYYLDTGDDGQPAGTIHVQDLRGGDDVNWRDASENGNGNYWLVEVKAPNDYQLLSQPMQFWVAPDLPTPGGLDNAADPSRLDYQGRLSFPVVGVGETANPDWGIGADPKLRNACSNPQRLPENGQASCIMPTGWLMQIYDTRLKPLPLTGGLPVGLALTLGSVIVLGLGAASAVVLRRRRFASQ